MYLRLQAILTDFLNAGLNPRTVTPTELRRHRTVNICAAIVLLGCFVFFWRAWQWDIVPRIVSLSYCGVATVTGLVLQRLHLSRALAAHLVLSGVFAAVSMAAYSSGGFGTPEAGWLYVIPMLAGLMLGGRACFWWGVATAGVIALLVLVEQMDGPISDMTPAAFRHRWDRVQQGAQLLFIVLITLSYLRQVTESEAALLSIIDKNNAEIAARIRAQEQTLAANRSRSEFLSSMSHELRTPLNAIIGFSRRLEQKFQAPARVDAPKALLALASIHRNGLILLNFINDLMDISKIESGAVSLNYSVVDLAQVLREVIARLDRQMEKPGITIRNDCAAVILLEADTARLMQVFSNLISNAVKYTDEGGVTITCCPSPRFDRGDGIAVAVRDTGLGIALEEQPYLFESYTNIGSPGARSVESSGLGLALTKQWVQMHGGSIDVASRLGEGSEFTVHLPLKKPTDHS